MWTHSRLVKGEENKPRIVALSDFLACNLGTAHYKSGFYFVNRKPGDQQVLALVW